jgi:hypothetical protein
MLVVQRFCEEDEAVEFVLDGLASTSLFLVV